MVKHYWKRLNIFLNIIKNIVIFTKEIISLSLLSEVYTAHKVGVVVGSLTISTTEEW